jgi:hypothetical protein
VGMAPVRNTIHLYMKTETQNASSLIYKEEVSINDVITNYHCIQMFLVKYNGYDFHQCTVFSLCNILHWSCSQTL